MGEHSNISWCDHTFNPWIGCTKVSDACKECYADKWNDRYHLAPGWGPGVPRHRTAPGYWKQPAKWNRQAVLTGCRPRIFSGSLCDVFDNEVDPQWRVDFWDVIRATPNLRWMLLTKRIGNARKMLPGDWPWPHAGIMATLENQKIWDRDFPKLMRVPATWHGVSVEPMLGPVDIGGARPDWLICGGESGVNHRHLPIEWVQSLRDQCDRNGIAFHFKQWGGIHPKSNSCMLDGCEYKAFPAQLAA